MMDDEVTVSKKKSRAGSALIKRFTCSNLRKQAKNDNTISLEELGVGKDNELPKNNTTSSSSHDDSSPSNGSTSSSSTLHATQYGFLAPSPVSETILPFRSFDAGDDKANRSTSISIAPSSSFDSSSPLPEYPTGTRVLVIAGGHKGNEGTVVGKFGAKSIKVHLDEAQAVVVVFATSLLVLM